jgi:hypothetical protein
VPAKSPYSAVPPPKQGTAAPAVVVKFLPPGVCYTVRLAEGPGAVQESAISSLGPSSTGRGSVVMSPTASSFPQKPIPVCGSNLLRSRPAFEKGSAH